MLRHGTVLAAVWLALGLPSLAAASEYCVTCEGPPALYRCVVEDTAEGPGKDPRVSLHCISEMAKRGKHENCAVSRGAPFPCPGLTAVVVQPGNLPPLAPTGAGPEPHATDAAHDEAAPPEAPEPTEKAEPAKVPRTVEELAGQTVRSSKEGLEKAGEAIGGTAKKAGEAVGQAGNAITSAATKTWTCITSLFSTCGDEPNAAEQATEPPPPPE